MGCRVRMWLKMRLRLIWRGILFDALSWLVKENRGADGLERLSDLSGINSTLSGMSYNCKDAANASYARNVSELSGSLSMNEAPAKLKH